MTYIERAGLLRTTLADHVAVVTGGGRGIGRETARALAHLGAAVVIAEVAESGRETEAIVRGDGGEAHFFACDVASPSEMARLGAFVQATYGRADVLVNNAIVLTVGPLVDLDVEAWDRVMAVNLRGAFLGVKTFLRGMLERRRGTVVMMASADGMPYIAPYLASKSALRSLAGSLAQEVGEESGVSVSCFGPGIVETPGLIDAFRGLAPRYGLSLEQFVTQSGLSLIPAELSAAGLVGTIVHAAAFHGHETSYVDGLARLGLDAYGDPLAAPTDPAETVAPAARDGAAALNREVAGVIRGYERDFREMNPLMRPVAKRMFRQDTGMTVDDWLVLVERRTRELESGMTDADRAAYAGDLRSLARHIAKQEAALPAWIRDREVLATALTQLRARRETVEAMAAALSAAPSARSA
jgi:NAD(P)-dependent dehydrogenase (short-subunit alcohol dehydrogenase family)